jgi:hypothetical protein
MKTTPILKNVDFLTVCQAAAILKEAGHAITPECLSKRLKKEGLLLKIGREKIVSKYCIFRYIKGLDAGEIVFTDTFYRHPKKKIEG